jgi:regulator of protease activity HflC (stomatin/prohibitin superfamily)
MNGWFIFALVIALFAAACGIMARMSKESRGKTNQKGAASDEAIAHGVFRLLFWILSVVTAIMVFSCSWTPVGPREIGVVSTFGKLTGHLGSGPNLIPPWSQETTIDGSYQPTDDSFTVRIAGGQTATANVYIRWNATQGAADDILANYKNTAGLEKGLLKPELNKAVNTVLEGYDPITPITDGIKAGTIGNPSTAQLSAQIETVLQSRISPDITVDTLVLQPLAYDPTVQGRINSITNQFVKTDVAKQSIQTALAQAQANNDLAASLNDNPLVLVQQCMTGLADGAIKLPAGGSCWPGQGSGVVIPAVTSTTTTTPAKGK